MGRADHRLLAHTALSRFTLLAATSLLGLTAFIAEPARADEYGMKGDIDHSVYFSVTGGYQLNDSDTNFAVDPADSKVGNLDSLQPGSDAWYTAVTMGQMIDSQWDWRASVQATFTGKDTSSASPPNPGNTEQWASNDLALFTADFELGYHPHSMEGLDLRLFAGPRLLKARNEIRYGYEDLDDSKLGEYEHNNSITAIGPRLGLDAVVPLQDSGPRFVTSVSGSMLFGDFNNRFSFDETCVGPCGSGSSSSSHHGTVYNLEGSAALQFDVVTNGTLELGYRAQQWWNLLDSVEDAESGDGDFVNGGRTDVFVHGPYATFTLKLGSGQ